MARRADVIFEGEPGRFVEVMGLRENAFVEARFGERARGWEPQPIGQGPGKTLTPKVSSRSYNGEPCTLALYQGGDAYGFTGRNIDQYLTMVNEAVNKVQKDRRTQEKRASIVRVALE